MDSASYGFEVFKRGDSAPYPMPFHVALSVRNVAAATAWYRDVLGFTVVFAMPMMGHVRWIKYADLLLMPGGEGLTDVGQGVKLTFQVWPEDISLDELAAQFRERGANIVEGPVVRPWNTSELLVRDPDGYILNFTQVDFARLGQNEELKRMLEEGRPT